MLVVGANGKEVLGCLEADEIVPFAREALARARRGDGYRQHNSRRSPSTQYARGRSGTCAPRDAVVDEQRSAAGDGKRRTVPAVKTLPAIELASLAGYDAPKVPIAESERANRIRVQECDILLADRPDCVLGLKWRSELANDCHIERRPERHRDLVRDRDPTAGRPDHDRACVAQELEPFRKLATCIMAIAEYGAAGVR
jgi:hypothetical protein